MSHVAHCLILLFVMCGSAIAQSLRTSAGDYRTPPGTAVADTLPADFPQPITTTVDHPAPGRIFIANISPLSISPTVRSYLMMLDDSAHVLKYRKIGANPNYVALDFTLQPDGVLSYFERGGGAPMHPVIRFLDSSWNPVRELRGVNLLNREQPSALSLPNGHTTLVVWNNVTMDLSAYVEGGDPEATVWEVTIQEFDALNNLVFQWRSLEHFPPSDSYSDLKGASVDYMHSNSVDVDREGNFIISDRHFSEITKISRSTGEVLWRLGGKHNQFTFIGEHEENAPNYFSYQHHAVLLPNGNLTLFDNGTQHTPPYSRAVEYRLDESAKTATLVWEYRHSPDIYASANGSVQRLPNGSTFIGWGQVMNEGEPSITEVRPDNSIAFELVLPKGQRSFKAFRHPWPACPPVATVGINEVKEGNTYEFNDTANVTGATVTFLQMKGFPYNNMTMHRYVCPPVNPRFSGRAPTVRPLRYLIEQGFIDTLLADVEVDVAAVPEITDPESVRVYSRLNAGSGMFTPLPTTFDAVSRTLTFRTDAAGEFIFASDPPQASAPPAPALRAPADGKRVSQVLPITLEWSPRGYCTASHLQLSKDAAFTDLVQDDTLASSLLATSACIAPEGSPDRTYYWRTRTLNEAGPGPWSAVWSFAVVKQFITVRSPNGGEAMQAGSSAIVRFERNTSSPVTISLHRNGVPFSTLKDSAANAGAYLWKVPVSTPPDSTYTIRVASVADGALSDESDGPFTINAAPTEVADLRAGAAAEFSLGQNHPNPFTRETLIDVAFHEDRREYATFSVHDLLGRIVLSRSIPPRSGGNIAVSAADLPGPGRYFYRLSVGNRSRVRIMTLLR